MSKLVLLKIYHSEQQRQYTNVYINDNFFEVGQLVKDNSKYVWLQWREALQRRDAIRQIEEQLLCS